MFFEKEIVIKGNYYISLEGGIERCYAKSAGKRCIYLEDEHFIQQSGTDEFAFDMLSDAVSFRKNLISKYQRIFKISKYQRIFKLFCGILVDEPGTACSQESSTFPQPRRHQKSKRQNNFLRKLKGLSRNVLSSYAIN
ncbi:hypothetical protein I4513_22865 [Klebsiella oxytoca]|uniref:hypothetical protein n=1 Tax=Klebsiella TaxID=570 RepID=UPI0013D57B48|nr:hypothetical protein [Klebsiella oxytoca]EKU6742236.1 hypothetical protein [Klebsiella oxytoca]EKU7136413.1 hypothetical protein [Klebsiella oxytoca]EKV0272830.1 hypothetical protein [Klebsiella oxytoca]EKV1581248.1 hypothetical protein [Klebsiella oxytoca]EKV9016048.1 hypothetical protein [Klebsiella oxytoca]